VAPEVQLPALHWAPGAQSVLLAQLFLHAPFEHT
jgi:hypothetical protein